MKEWILSVGLMVLLVSIVSIILPDGKIGKQIKNIFSILILLTILNPLVNIKNSKFENDFIVNDADINIQEEYLNYFYENQKISLETSCDKIISNLGISNGKTLLEYEVSDMYFNIIKAKVDLSNAVINSNEDHIFVINEVKRNLIEYLNISEEQVEII